MIFESMTEPKQALPHPENQQHWIQQIEHQKDKGHFLLVVILQITHPFIFGEKSTVFPAPCLSVENHIWGPAWSFQRWDEWQSELRGMRVTEDGWGLPHDSHSGGLQGFNKSFTKEKRGKHTPPILSPGLCEKKNCHSESLQIFHVSSRKKQQKLVPIPPKPLFPLYTHWDSLTGLASWEVPERVTQATWMQSSPPGWLQFFYEGNP